MPLIEHRRVLEYVAAAGAVAGVGALYYWATHRPVLQLDSTALASGGYAVWNAGNLDPEHVYIIGPVLTDGSLYYNPTTDTISGVDSAHGIQQILPEMVGGTQYVIYDDTIGQVVASIPVTVSS